jgi:hypothetical protein
MDQPLPPSPSSIPPEKVDELIRAMEAVRDDLLKVSFLLRDHLDETDMPARARACEATVALIRQCKAG